MSDAFVLMKDLWWRELVCWWKSSFGSGDLSWILLKEAGE